MVSPYPDSVNNVEIGFLDAHGFKVSVVLSFGCTMSRETARVTPETIVETVMMRRREIVSNDVLFLTCTGFRAVDVVDTLEKRLDVPVITSNSAALWLALSRLAVDCRAVKLGRLFRRAPKMDSLKTAIT